MLIVNNVMPQPSITLNKLQPVNAHKHELDGVIFNPDINSASQNSSSLPSSDVLSQSIDETLGKLDSVRENLSLMPKEMVMADIFSFMALINEMNIQMKKFASMDRESHFQKQIQTLRDGINDMKEAATARFAAAITSSVVSGAGAAAQVGFASSSMKSSLKGADTKPVLNKDNPIKDSLTGTKHASYAQAAGIGAPAVGSGAAAGITTMADAADAKKSEKDILAKKEETSVSRSEEAFRGYSDIIADLMSKMRDLVAALAANEKSITDRSM